MSSRAIPAECSDVREGGEWTTRQRLKNDLIYIAIRVMLVVVRFAPRRLVALGCTAIGALAFRLLRRERERARARLESGLGVPASHEQVRAAFLGVAAALADTLTLLDPTERASYTLVLDPDARATFRTALVEGKGVVFVSAHLGPWERMAALLVEEGFPVATVARESYDPRLTRLYEKLRAPRGVRSIYRGNTGAVARIARELASGGAVGFLIDLPSRVRCTRARLFGVEADIPVGPARIALSRRSAVVVGTCAGGKVRIERISSADLKADSKGETELIRRLACALDNRIAAQPDAWLGLFAPFRRSYPSGESGE